MTAYDFTARSWDGQDCPLEQFRGKVLLIFNSATGCGFTPQYDALQQLYEAHRAQGFEILDFPCNQFGAQAPGTDAEIHRRCTGQYRITFSRFAKVEVLGEQAAPLFRWLTEQTVFSGFGESPMASILEQKAAEMDKDFRSNSRIKWNFTKFLIGRDGSVLARFEPTVPMEQVAAQISACL